MVEVLVVEDDRVRRWGRRHRSEDLVVVSPAFAEPVSLRVDSQRGGNDELHLLDRDRGLDVPDDFRNAVEPRALGLPVADHPVEQAILACNGEQDRDPPRERPVQKRARVRLHRAGQVTGDR